MPATACPSHAELLAYTLGSLSDVASDDVAAHLGSCPDCQAELASFDDLEDTFVAQLRRPPPADPYRAEPQCQVAVAQALAVLDRSSDDQASRSLCGKALGEYQLIEQLGHGGMGTVYKALHTKLDRVVAIKVLALGRAHDQRAIARFEREMKAIGKLDHRHIVRAYDAREIDGTPTLVMEYTDGLDVGEIVHRVGPLDTHQACEIARQAALGLQYVHEHGLVHRDVKPSNLMLTSDGEIKILDLGLARFHLDQPWDDELAGTSRAVGGEMTATDQAMGTADYMAPEQVTNCRDVDIRADIYGLGCTLYKLLSGRTPFSGPEHNGPLEKMAAHTSESAPPIRQFCPDIPDGLAAVLDRMLAKSPEARYAIPAEVVEALAPWCAGADLMALLRRATEGEEEPISGGDRRSPPPRAARTARKPRPLLAFSGRKWIVAALGLSLIGGLGFASGIIVHIKKGDQEITIEPPTGSSVSIAADGQVHVELPGQAKVENKFLATQLREAKAGNFWAKYRLWAAYRKGTDGVPKNPEEARKWLTDLVKGVSLATFRPVDPFAPKTPGEFLTKFSMHSALRSEATGLGGASFFRTTAKDGVLIGSFLTVYPDQMRRDIAAMPFLQLVSIEKLTPEMFVRHEASAQESLGAIEKRLLRRREIARREETQAEKKGAGPVAAAPTLLRWKFTPGQTLRCLITEDLVEMVQIADGPPMTAMFRFEKDDIWKIASVDKQGVATLDSTIDRIKMKLQSPQGVLVDYDTAAGKEPTGMATIFAQVANVMVKKISILRINPRGEVLEATPPQGVLESMKKIFPGVSSFGDFFGAEGVKKMQATIQFPQEPLTKGQTWTRKEDFRLPVLFGTLGIDEKYEYLGTERRRGRELQKIGITLAMTSGEEKPGPQQHGAAKQGQQKQATPLLKFKNSDVSGTIYFDNAQGRTVESTMKMKIVAEINCMGERGTLDIEGHVRIDLVPADDAKAKSKP